jgi:hypothetical protein
VEFRLRSPDEADARTTFEADHPELMKAREHRIKELTPVRELFDQSEPEGDIDTEESEEEEKDDGD